MFNCLPGKSVFPNQEKMDNHDSSPKDNIFMQCKHCCKIFDDKNILEKHVKVCPTEKCVICDKWWKKMHITRHMTTLETNTVGLLESTQGTSVPLGSVGFSTTFAPDVPGGLSSCQAGSTGRLPSLHTGLLGSTMIFMKLQT